MHHWTEVACWLDARGRRLPRGLVVHAPTALNTSDGPVSHSELLRAQCIWIVSVFVLLCGSYDSAWISMSCREARALVRQVDEARSALALYRTSEPARVHDRFRAATPSPHAAVAGGDSLVDRPTWAILMTRRVGWNRSRIRAGRRCYRCPRNKPSTHVPGIDLRKTGAGDRT